MAKNSKGVRAARVKAETGARAVRTLSGLTLDTDRALFGSENLKVENCRFEGPACGESALLESRDCTVNGCSFALKFPFWHNERVTVLHSRLAESCEAPFWYGSGIRVAKTEIRGSRAFRACTDVVLTGCDIESAECGWDCRDVTIGGNGRIESTYFLLGARNVHMRDTALTGSDSFRAVIGGEIRDCILNGDAAFWHSEDLLVTDCVINGDRLGWYSKNLRLVRCRITGSKPLCRCEHLVLEDCTMEGCDLAFEYSTLDATVLGGIASVRNPVHGSVSADRIGNIILNGNRRPESDCVIRTKQ